ncbi:hypothetical protein CUR178_04103 [Leishmania enriettii]|uniref:Uncharacterized protein n=1 Tax=Leishmania enriettii TaxID=5663 RepID=A0A836KIE7_LEIEN|nr:hypothetical protein CUR178_04103 [Leishmania enriettii]
MGAQRKKGCEAGANSWKGWEEKQQQRRGRASFPTPVMSSSSGERFRKDSTDARVSREARLYPSPWGTKSAAAATAH